jgi:hypothetical protein
MKPDPTVKKETLYILLGESVMTALMLAVFLILDRFSLRVALGAVVGAAVSVLNFFFMALTVQKSLTTPEEDHAKLMRASQSMRFLLMALTLILCLALAKLNVIATLVPLLFPRIVILIRGIAIAKNDSSDKGA